jgi:transposase
VTAPGRKNADLALAAALAAGQKIEDAAAQAGVSASTAYRRLRSPPFRQRVDELRGRMVEATVGRLADLGAEAV